MRNKTWLGAIMVGLVWAGTAKGQLGDSSTMLTGVKPQSVVFQKVIDVPEMAGPQIKPQTLDRLSLRQMLSKVIPFLSPSSPPSFASAVPLLPGSNVGSPFQPMLPQFGLPAPGPAGPYQPLLPTTTLPRPKDFGALKPVLPRP